MTSLISRFTSAQELQRRLSGCIIGYKNDWGRVVDLSSESMSFYDLKTRSEKIIGFEEDDDNFNYTKFNIGYIDRPTSKTAEFLYRVPQKKTEQGLTTRNVWFKQRKPNHFGDHPFHDTNEVGVKKLCDMLDNKYMSAGEAWNFVVDSNSVLSASFNKSLCFNRLGLLTVGLEYQGSTIGEASVSKDGLTPITFYERYQYLSKRVCQLAPALKQMVN